MWEELIQLAVGNGIFAVMFVYLLMFELKDSRTRENKYQNTIDKLAQDLGEVETISQNIVEVKLEINQIKDEIKSLKTAMLKNRICPLYACKTDLDFQINSNIA